MADHQTGKDIFRNVAQGLLRPASHADSNIISPGGDNHIDSRQSRTFGGQVWWESR